MKLARVLVAALVLTIGGPRAVQADGWFSNAFSSTKSSTTQKPPPWVKTTKPPSALERLSTGTKNFFSGIGAALTPKKTAPKSSTMADSPWIRAQTASKPPQKSSWSLFGSAAEPKKPKSPADFLSMKRLDP